MERISAGAVEIEPVVIWSAFPLPEAVDIFALLAAFLAKLLAFCAYAPPDAAWIRATATSGSALRSLVRHPARNACPVPPIQDAMRRRPPTKVNRLDIHNFKLI